MIGRVVVIAGALAGLGVAAVLGRVATRRAHAVAAASELPPRLRTVRMFATAFQPARLEAVVGDTVEWTNADLITHSASADDGKAFDSPDLAPGQTWRTVVAARGTYAYTCALHPTMKATVVVK